MELEAIALQAAGGFVTGALVGYAIKKALKAFLTLLGLWLASIVALAYYGIATINWERLNELVYQLISWLGGETANLASLSLIHI